MVIGETCAVELRVSLPVAVAAEVEEVKEQDPEFLTKVLTYGIVRRLMFDHLRRRDTEHSASLS